MAKVIAVELEKILEKYGKDVDEALKKASITIADDTKELLRATSPKKTGRYARGWTVTARVSQYGRKIWVVRNADRYQLTHLLERGHALRGGGRARAFPHIKKAELKAKRNLVRDLKKELK